jgi:hypothetical protein
MDTSAVLLWDKSDSNRGMVNYNFKYGLAGRTFRGLPAPPIQVTATDDSLLVLDASGLLKILDRDNFDTEYEYHSPGLKKVIAVDRNTIVGGGSRTTLFRSALIRINSSTGETVPVEETGLLVYDLLFDQERGRLFTLSVGCPDEQTITCVHQRPRQSWEKTQTLMQYDGEDLSATLAFQGGELYSSLGYSQVQVWSSGRTGKLQKTRHIPRQLAVLGRLLISLNRNSTLTIWDRETHRVVADLYVFKDYSWIAVFPNENAYISKDADGYLILP